MAVAIERARRRSRLAAAFLCASLAVTGLVLVSPSPSSAALKGWRTISYRGERMTVPSTWPVFDLARRPSVCVRFNRHAVYLGAASAEARCPAQSVGIATAVQLEPLTSAAELGATHADVATMLNGQHALVNGDAAVVHRLVAAFPARGVLVSVSYRSDAALAQQILHSVAATTPAGPGTVTAALGAGSATAGGLGPPAVPSATLTAASTTTSSSVGPVLYQGQGFDTCQAPTEKQMAVWRTYSPFDAVGVYIGGVNAACTNVTATWIADESNAGWHIFPLYVGLQSPCAFQSGMASLSWNPTTAFGQGKTDAKDAISDAESLGIPAGATIDYDMEAWNTSKTDCNAATLDFITGWTEALHAAGYGSAMYGSLLSGVSSPGAQTLADSGSKGCPDVIYFAYWNGKATTQTSYLPSSDWADHQRMKQYQGDVTLTYGPSTDRVQINVDEDYLDAPTIGDPQPTVTSLSPTSAPVGNTVTVAGTNFVPGQTTVTFGTVVSTKVNVLSPDELTALVPPEAPATVPVTVTTPGGTSPAAPASTTTAAPAVGLTIVPFVSTALESSGGYLLASSLGNIENFHARFEGSAATRTLTAPVVGVAATSTGYLLASAKGNVFTFHTPWYGSTANKTPPAPVVGIAATSTGYLLVTSKGNVYNFHTSWYGSMVHKILPAPVVGIAASASGYLLATSRGNIYNFNTPFDGSLSRRSIPSPIMGIATDSGGYLLASARGDVYTFTTPFYGSPATK